MRTLPAIPVLHPAHILRGSWALEPAQIAHLAKVAEGLREGAAVQAEMLEHVSRLSDTVIDQAIALKHYSQQLEERVRQRTAELNDANHDAIYMLAVASEAKDQDTGDHVRRIQDYCAALALAMPTNVK